MLYGGSKADISSELALNRGQAAYLITPELGFPSTSPSSFTHQNNTQRRHCVQFHKRRF